MNREEDVRPEEDLAASTGLDVGSGTQRRRSPEDVSAWVESQLHERDPALTPAMCAFVWRGIERRQAAAPRLRGVWVVVGLALALVAGLAVAYRTSGRGTGERFCVGALACREGFFRVRAIDPGTSLDVVMVAPSAVELRLHGGRVYVEVQPGGATRVRVGDAVLSARGGRFEVARESEAFGAGVRVRADEGAVDVEHPGARTTVHPGEGSRRFGVFPPR